MTSGNSVFDFFTIGIGPSSSHTVGPMRAACRFVNGLRARGELPRVTRIGIELFGSLALTGKGHGTDRAILAGLEGAEPETVDPERLRTRVDEIRVAKRIRLADEHEIDYDDDAHFVYRRRQTRPEHPNAMTLIAYLGDTDDGDGDVSETYFSLGGGFVVRADELKSNGSKISDDDAADAAPLPCPFDTAAELLALAGERGVSISDLALENETALRAESEVRARLLEIWAAMQDCVERGCRTEGLLPGGLKVARRAPNLRAQLVARAETGNDPLDVMDWINVFALAVNEENAAGGRVVTAPTNGAAGIVPAVLHYYHRFSPGADDDGVVRFLLTAGAIAMLYKKNASISGAEVGCQGEVGVACSMAAGALAEVLGGTPAQVEEAAEIGMEHNLGLTCDPIGGLVQIPCIERNTMGAVKAVNAARLALAGDGTHHVSLDRVIATMRRTGADMSSKYKETSRGGLAVNVSEC
jgi:L-serine dehydratase